MGDNKQAEKSACIFLHKNKKTIEKGLN